MESKDTLRKLGVTAFGLGLLPVAPGTWASLVAAALYWALRAHATREIAVPALAVAILVALALAYLLCPWARRTYGEDPGLFVLDEVVGQWFACLLMWRLWRDPLTSAAVAFVAFRLFDIVKPPPIRRVEQIKGTWGVLLDDVLAAAYAAAVLTVAVRLSPML